MDRPTGLVLAGGAGRRLGRPKGELRVEGRSLALRAAEALEPLCGRVLISVGPASASPAPGYVAITDAGPPGRGPLVGIEAGFAAAGSRDLLVLACDYPRVGTDLLRRIVDSADEWDEVVLVRDPEGRDHPLVALWRRSVRERLREALERGRNRVATLIEACAARRLGSADLPGIDLGSCLLNLNRPEDLARLGSPE